MEFPIELKCPEQEGRGKTLGCPRHKMPKAWHSLIKWPSSSISHEKHCLYNYVIITSCLD